MSCLILFTPAIQIPVAAAAAAPENAIGTINALPDTAQLQAVLETNTVRQSNWIVLPPWLAGTWEARSEIVLDGYDYQNACSTVDKPQRISVRRVTTLGTQYDAHGRVWHCADTPYERVTQTDSFTEIHTIKQLAIVTSELNEVVVRTMGIVQRLDPKTRELLDIFIERTTTSYTPLQNNLLYVTFVIDDFDMQGRAIYSSNIVCTQTRTKPFVPTMQDERGDLKQKFREFLISHRMNDALPR